MYKYFSSQLHLCNPFQLFLLYFWQENLTRTVDYFKPKYYECKLHPSNPDWIGFTQSSTIRQGKTEELQSTSLYIFTSKSFCLYVYSSEHFRLILCCPYIGGWLLLQYYTKYIFGSTLQLQHQQAALLAQLS